jgi:protein-S-isoprenylcysteine O-methyltransferase Ste14
MPAPATDNPGVVAIPPFIALAVLAVGLAGHAEWPLRFVPAPGFKWVGAVSIGAAAVLLTSAVRAMRRARTTFDVRKPTTAIVTSGAFRISRNPMYVSLMLSYLGIAVLVDSLWVLLLALPLAVILQKGVIEREERYLERKFGETYTRYKAGVRRWL